LTFGALGRGAGYSSLKGRATPPCMWFFCLNGLRFSATISAHRWWIVVSISGISSPM
jgi:hypothetical protein